MKEKRLIIVIILAIVSIIILTSILIGYPRIHHPELFRIQYGPYDKHINRDYQNETELELISIAENIPPPDGIWWFDEFDNIKLADCVNNESIEYYSELIDKIKEDHDYTGIFIEYATFIYNANVSYRNNSREYNASVLC